MLEDWAKPPKTRPDSPRLQLQGFGGGEDLPRDAGRRSNLRMVRQPETLPANYPAGIEYKERRVRWRGNGSAVGSRCQQTFTRGEILVQFVRQQSACVLQPVLLALDFELPVLLHQSPTQPSQGDQRDSSEKNEENQAVSRAHRGTRWYSKPAPKQIATIVRARIRETSGFCHACVMIAVVAAAKFHVHQMLVTSLEPNRYAVDRSFASCGVLGSIR